MHNKDKADIVFCTHIGQSVPAKYTFDTDSNVVQIRENQIDKHFGIGFDVLTHLDYVLSAYNAEMHMSSM